MRLIGITGKAGSGKSALADILTRHYGYTEVSLAGPIKEIVQRIWGVSDDALWGPSERRAELLRPELPATSTVRRALQTLGTEWGRALDEDVWVRLAIREAKKHTATVVPDVRFENEARVVREHGGSIWRIVRPGYESNAGTAHSSETEMDQIRADSILVNSGTLDELDEMVDANVRALERLRAEE